MSVVKKKVMGFGTFDGLHPGHLDYFRQLRSLGDELIIVISRDENVKKIKGRLPRFTEKERLLVLQQTGLIDRLVLGNNANFYQCLIDHNPDVIGLGYDQGANTEQIQKQFPSIQIIRLNAFEPTKYKSSLLIKD